MDELKSFLYYIGLVEEELKILEAYRELFEKIKSQDLGLEYTGHELIHYYKNIEENKNKYED